MRAFAIGIAILGCTAGAAFAADPVVYAPTTPGVVEDTSGFDWDGLYAGVSAWGISWNGGLTEGNFGLVAGFNVTADQLLFGVEGEIGGYYDSTATSGWYATAEARAGYLLTPDVLGYLSAGGYHYDGSANYYMVGGGVEFAASDNLSIDLEYRYKWGFLTFTSHQVGASALWHFN